jgi:8-oxo-dGTP diphosphatase
VIEVYSRAENRNRLTRTCPCDHRYVGEAGTASCRYRYRVRREHRSPRKDNACVGTLTNASASLDQIWARASKAIAAAAIILNSDGGVLLVKHSYGPLNWELPGGAAERDESPTETAVREVLEETGLRVGAERLTGVYYEQQGPGREAVHFVFFCQSLDGTAIPQPDGGEVTACGYWSREALPRPISDFTIRRIQDGLTTRGSVLPVTITPRQWLT